MAVCKAVCDAGQGGMILVSADAVERVFIESLEQKVMVSEHSNMPSNSSLIVDQDKVCIRRV